MVLTTSATVDAHRPSQSTPVIPIRQPLCYDAMYRLHNRMIKGVVYHSGIPASLVEDVSQEIVVRILAQDGLSKFNWSTPAPERVFKAFVKSYTLLSTRAWITRWRNELRRTVPLDLVEQVILAPEAAVPIDFLLEALLCRTEGDAHTFILIASEHRTYRETRLCLVKELGWSTNRVFRAVKSGRCATREYLACA